MFVCMDYLCHMFIMYTLTVQVNRGKEFVNE